MQGLKTDEVFGMDEKKVIVGMSGGVDSSVAAYKLRQEGYEVTGIALRFWTKEQCAEKWEKSCCSYYDVEDARNVAFKLDIPFYVIDVSREFRREVIDYFINEYMSGRTPNPCVVCNERVKFRVLARKADELGAFYIATGHYAGVIHYPAQGRYILREARDCKKDQSYFLFSLGQEQLTRTILPLSDMTKDEVRRCAQKLGLVTHDKASSQEVCFTCGEHTGTFLGAHVSDQASSGDIVSAEGVFLGRHRGLYRYTIGQRRGIGVAARRPLYVVKKDIPGNRLVVGERGALRKREFYCERLNWMAPELPIGKKVPCLIKIRYRQQKLAGTICCPIEQPSTVHVLLNEDAYAVTPGQAAVFYDDTAVLGGGWICDR
ncbi:MAG: tRNA 2-thiouridine(34) synthase MnmA [Candidatus Omnitrophica bacterium]|nr:tRNA 2-thiouridine(34) synthase MnmA [Candidatus Omnitrophota bacterium]